MSRVTIVVPCFDEAARLPAHAFRAFAAEWPDIAFLFVDDGSRDATAQLLDSLAAELGDRGAVLALGTNHGKAEAVRRGILAAIDAGAEYVGFWDADLATPLDTLPEFVRALDADPAIRLVMGARVRLLGRSVERHAFRHYAGRIFATTVGVMLHVPVYDTQCGAKLLRASAECRRLFEAPFLTRWLMDVEIIARMIRDGATPATLQRTLCELPLQRWMDVSGSKLRTRDFLRAIPELTRIHAAYLAGGRAGRGVAAGEAAASLAAGDVVAGEISMPGRQPATAGTTFDF